jgi:hypothetical protein
LVKQRSNNGQTSAPAGYSVPLEGFLYRRPKGKLRLLMELSTSFNDVWVEQLTTRVVLPEGAKHIKATVRHALHCSKQLLGVVSHAAW